MDQVLVVEVSPKGINQHYLASTLDMEKSAVPTTSGQVCFIPQTYGLIRRLNPENSNSRQLGNVVMVSPLAGPN